MLTAFSVNVQLRELAHPPYKFIKASIAHQSSELSIAHACSLSDTNSCPATKPFLEYFIVLGCMGACKHVVLGIKNWVLSE